MPKYRWIADFEAWSDDRRFGVRVKASELRRMFMICINAGLNETGGILIGRYMEVYRRADVSMVVGPPSDSRAGKTWFHRGIAGLQGLLDRCWNGDRLFYLGEWHYHRASSPDPSSQDIDQMMEISSGPAWNCPEAVLILVSRHPSSEWLVHAYVFPRGKPLISCSPRYMVHWSEER